MLRSSTDSAQNRSFIYKIAACVMAALFAMLLMSSCSNYEDATNSVEEEAARATEEVQAEEAANENNDNAVENANADTTSTEVNENTNS
ncbi:MAG: hypothetical protein LUB61_01435 [Eggerthellaceae bacterium]|nr:hypothetical protein [Eggerthellaceae bacterium]